MSRNEGGTLPAVEDVGSWRVTRVQTVDVKARTEGQAMEIGEEILEYGNGAETSSLEAEELNT